MTNPIPTQIKAQVKQKYPWITDEEIDICYGYALHDFIRISYPSQNNRPSANDIDIDFLTAQWICQRMSDILERGGGSSVTSYKENGISWTYAASYIDPNLSKMIMPKARVPR